MSISCGILAVFRTFRPKASTLSRSSELSSCGLTDRKMKAPTARIILLICSNLIEPLLCRKMQRHWAAIRLIGECRLENQTLAAIFGRNSRGS